MMTTNSSTNNAPQDVSSPPRETEEQNIEVEQGNEETTTMPTEEETKEKRQQFRKKLIVAAILIIFIGFVIADSLTNQYIADGLESFLEWIEENPAAGIFVFVIVYFVATVLFVPGSILTLGAGFVFGQAFGLGLGVLAGTVAVFIGASAGAIVAFLLGRFLLRDWVSGFTKKYTIFEALDKAFEEKGLRIMTLLRLSPIIPFNAINYIAGVTALGFWSYFWALLAIIPGTTLYVFLGASAGSLSDSESGGDDPTITIIVVVVGIIFGFGAIIMTSYYAKQELNKVAEQRRVELEDMEKDEETGDTPTDTNASDQEN